MVFFDFLPPILPTIIRHRAEIKDFVTETLVDAHVDAYNEARPLVQPMIDAARIFAKSFRSYRFPIADKNIPCH